MEMTGEEMIGAPVQRVWAALNDPEVLRRSIEGCEAFERTSDTSFEARVAARIGPVKLGFEGVVSLIDLDPPHSYTLVGEGAGAGAGFARGQARVTLTDAGGATRLSYAVRAEVGGKLAQIGARLIDQTAKRQAESFFARFAAIVTEGPPAPAPAAGAGWAHGPSWLWAAVMAAAALLVGFAAGRLWG
jgi:carbon monoxide dehydrogenase subunit G